jgi:hypothetical protein
MSGQAYLVASTERASAVGQPGLAGWVDVTGRSNELSRRRILRAGALAALAAPLAAACSNGLGGGGDVDAPDPLAGLLAQAQAAAASAQGATDGVAGQVAVALAAQAAALKAEVDRLNRPASEAGPVDTAKSGSGLAGLKKPLADLRKQATALLPDQTGYRAGLVASIAAGAAGLQRLDPALGPGDNAGALAALAATKLASASADAIQKALSAEHAALWIYGLATAYLPAEYGNALRDGTAEHAQRRDLCEQALTAAGLTPVNAEPAYVPPKPVTDGPSAMAVVAAAEDDTTSAWLGVVGAAGEPGLRTLAGEALIATVRRATPWRVEAGTKPPVAALPGIAAT